MGNSGSTVKDVVNKPIEKNIIELINENNDKLDPYIGVLFNILLVLCKQRDIALIHWNKVEKNDVKNIIQLNIISTKLGLKGLEIDVMEIGKPYSFYIYNDDYRVEIETESERKSYYNYPNVKGINNNINYYEDNKITNDGLQDISTNLNFDCDCSHKDYDITISIVKDNKQYQFYKMFCNYIDNDTLINLKDKLKKFKDFKNKKK